MPEGQLQVNAVQTISITDIAMYGCYLAGYVISHLMLMLSIVKSILIDMAESGFDLATLFTSVLGDRFAMFSFGTLDFR